MCPSLINNKGFKQDIYKGETNTYRAFLPSTHSSEKLVSALCGTWTWVRVPLKAETNFSDVCRR